jgi:hypothetical protein
MKKWWRRGYDYRFIVLRSRIFFKRETISPVEWNQQTAKCRQRSGMQEQRMLAFLKKRSVRWVRASILVILLGGGALLYWYSRVSLADFVDLDLVSLDDTPQTPIDKMLNQILPDQFPGPRTKWERLLKRILPAKFEHKTPLKALKVGQVVEDGFEPWSLWRLKTKTWSGFILFEADSPLPGGWDPDLRASGARIHFLDATGQYESTFEFCPGYGIYLVDAAFGNHEIVGAPVIEIKTRIIDRAFSQWTSDTRQFYGIVDKRLALLRIESEEGKVLANRYDDSHVRLGPSPPERTKEQWEELLLSSDRVLVLEALTWIAGRNFTFLAEAVRESLVVQKRIAELAESENEWIREAAVLAREQFQKKKIETAEDHPFVGKWKLLNDEGQAGILTLTASGALLEGFPKNPGKLVGIVGQEELRIVWANGVQDILRQDKGQFILLSLGQDASWDSPPLSRLRAIRIAP